MTEQREEPALLSERDQLAFAALRQLLWRTTDADPEMGDTIIDAAGQLVDRLDDQHERIQQLEAKVERLEATSSGPELSKREKHEAIINAAENKHASGQGGPAGTDISYGEVMAAASVSRRYSYTLMEEIAAKYEWASYDTSGNKNKLKIHLEGREWAELIASVHKNVSED